MLEAFSNFEHTSSDADVERGVIRMLLDCIFNRRETPKIAMFDVSLNTQDISL
jgi:hypothetical protein